MVLLAASVCTRGGKPVISRQFKEMSRSRVESLLSSFPKLLPTGSQHTTIETEHVRYVYQPLEDLYMILITNKSSNILQDIDTLHLFARVVSDLCRSLDERDILRNSFELLGAFDEIVSFGYRENVSLPQVRTILEMDSHEEKIQEIIERNKELEAKEELKRRAKQLEVQRRDATRRGPVGNPSYGGMGSMGSSGYSALSRGYESPTVAAPVVRDTGADAAPALRPFKGKGMQLGKKARGTDLLGALTPESASREEAAAAPSHRLARSSAAASNAVPTAPLDSLPPVQEEAIHVTIKERVSIAATRDGSLSSLEVKGDLELKITDPAFAKVRLQLSEPSSSSYLADAGELQYKTHPHVDKAVWSASRLITLKDVNRPFPVNQNLGVLRWRLTSKDESLVPLSISCWPSVSGDGTGEVNVEFELEAKDLVMRNVVIAIPLPEGAGQDLTAEAAVGGYSVDEESGLLLWTIDQVDAANSSGSLEFTVSQGAEAADVFFPVNVNFVSEQTLSATKVESISSASGDTVSWSSQQVLSADSYSVT
ncbi:hypothetical protein BCV69DRAFT_282609 [Microstroma glucosiphilum]|uniref:Coatomer subunit delta n=1 Tax=Pseudomicrostroma glucosiphilum TaxID=1684307 RepID=A0A316U9F9_9BASI|nr:hypothetical protein BCV69DRAFT_282609 [Pseudomicrostroma glucosiphilum]PWN21111.1 hypothetical protein BCV69DRAFT_282609 [Pseudomicrostroma glucosiphilum]